MYNESWKKDFFLNLTEHCVFSSMVGKLLRVFPTFFLLKT